MEGYKKLSKVKPVNEADDSLELFSNWSKTEGKKKRLADYRKLAEIDENFIITEDNINEWALSNAAFMNYYSRDTLREELLEVKE